MRRQTKSVIRDPIRDPYLIVTAKEKTLRKGDMHFRGWWSLRR